MKKLMLVAAIVCAAATSQAVQVKWNGVAYALDAAGVTDNGVYSVGSGTLYNNGSIDYIITFYQSGTEVYSTSGTETLSALGKGNVTLNPSELVKSTAYTYTIVLSGTQADLAARGIDGAYDYSGATISTTINGSFTTKASGITQLNTTADSVTSWTVSGITAATPPTPGPTPVPEPTSGLLLLLGVAGLALRRRRA